MTAPEPDTEGCLIVVAGYDDLAFDLELVTNEAARGIMASPSLGDFFEVCFANLGPRPIALAEDNAAAALIAGKLTHPDTISGLNYFALVVADRSETAAEQLLTDCDAHPIIKQLPLRRRVLAIADSPDPDPEPVGEQVPAPGTAFRNRSDLARELQRYAQELLQAFAAGDEPGLTPDQLDQIGSAGERQAVNEQLPRLSETGWPEPGRRQLARPIDALRLAPRKAANWQWRNRGHTSHGRQTAAPPPLAAIDGPARQAPGLAYLILIANRNIVPRRLRRRGRSVVRKLDRALAADPYADHRVRVLQSAGRTSIIGPAQAGRLKRWSISRPIDLSLPRALSVIRSDIECDLARGIIQDPAVVFYAAAMPCADATTVALHTKLANEASVTWIAAGHLAGLLPSRLTDKASHVLHDTRETVSQVITLLHHEEVPGSADLADPSAER